MEGTGTPAARVERAFRENEVVMGVRAGNKVDDSRRAVELLHSPPFLDTGFHVERKSLGANFADTVKRMRSVGAGALRASSGQLDEAAFG